MRLDNALFTAAVRRVAIISTDRIRAVRLSVETGRMILTVRNMDASQAVEELEVGYEGEPFEVNFNARFLLDATAQIGEIIELRLTENTQTGVVTDAVLALDPADPGV